MLYFFLYRSKKKCYSTLVVKDILNHSGMSAEEPSEL